MLVQARRQREHKCGTWSRCIHQSDADAAEEQRHITRGRYADGEFEAGTHAEGEPTGDGVRWSADQTSACRLRDGEIVEGPPIIGAQARGHDIRSLCSSHFYSRPTVIHDAYLT